MGKNMERIYLLKLVKGVMSLTRELKERFSGRNNI